ncbi:MAG: hypothetical protein H6711_01530 [Myxococcales bacterium]|nr:hypothetical protein [Myxococcales bacterium]
MAVAGAGDGRQEVDDLEERPRGIGGDLAVDDRSAGLRPVAGAAVALVADRLLGEAGGHEVALHEDVVVAVHPAPGDVEADRREGVLGVVVGPRDRVVVDPRVAVDLARAAVEDPLEPAQLVLLRAVDVVAAEEDEVERELAVDRVDRPHRGVEHLAHVALLRAEGGGEAVGGVEVGDPGRRLVVGELGVSEVDEAGHQRGPGARRRRLAEVERAILHRLAGGDVVVAVALVQELVELGRDPRVEVGVARGREVLEDLLCGQRDMSQGRERRRELLAGRRAGAAGLGAGRRGGRALGVARRRGGRALVAGRALGAALVVADAAGARDPEGEGEGEGEGEAARSALHRRMVRDARRPRRGRSMFR